MVFASRKFSLLFSQDNPHACLCCASKWQNPCFDGIKKLYLQPGMYIPEGLDQENSGHCKTLCVSRKRKKTLHMKWTQMNTITSKYVCFGKSKNLFQIIKGDRYLVRFTKCTRFFLNLANINISNFAKIRCLFYWKSWG